MEATYQTIDLLTLDKDNNVHGRTLYLAPYGQADLPTRYKELRAQLVALLGEPTSELPYPSSGTHCTWEPKHPMDATTRLTISWEVDPAYLSL